MDTGCLKALLLVSAALFLGTAKLPAQFMPALSSGNLLVCDGRFFGKIYIPENAAPEERAAAEFLAEQIKTVTGAIAEIKCAGESGAPDAGIYVGNTPQAIARKIEAPAAAGETWRWESRAGRALFIRGNSPLATRLAVGDYAQRELGVFFLMPGEFGAEWRAKRTLRLPAPYAQKPAFAWRVFSFCGGKTEREWARNNGVGLRPEFSHNLHSVFDAKAFTEHPEFFSIVGGVVQKPANRGGYEPQPNLAAPGAAEYAAGCAAEFFGKNPDAPMFSLGVTDNMTWDESPVSAPLLGRGNFFRGKPDYSDYVFSFMNCAAGALDKNPAVPAEKFLSCIAYYHCENTPSFPVHPRVFPVLTADRTQWRDPAFKQNDRELIRRWAKSGVKNFGIYDYYYGNDYLIPRIFFENEIESIRFAFDAGAKLFYAEVAPNWGFDAPKIWLAAQLIQSPNRSASLLLRQFFKNAYGPAAGGMKEFYALAEQCWNEQPGPARWIKFWRMENAGALISPEMQRRMRAAITTAENAFPEPAPLTRREDDERVFRQKVRVRMTSQAFAMTERFLEYYRIREKLLSATPETPADVHEAVALLVAEENARNEFLDTFEKWKKSPMNPGGVPSIRAFFTGDIDATVYVRLAEVCLSKINAGAGGDLWQDALQAVADRAMTAGFRAALESAVFPEESTVLAADGFDKDSFRLPIAGAWSHGRDITILKAPWKIVLFENEFVRAGYSKEHPYSGDGCLWICGGEQTTFSRRAPVSGRDKIVSKIRIRGRVNPGTYAGIETCFFDKDGKSIGRTISIIHPMRSETWKPVVAFAVAPANAASVGVSIRNMSQEADEALFIDDFRIEKI